LLTRSIDFDDPFALTIEEKFFLHAKRLCVMFAGVALTLSALDLMNVRMVENTAEYFHNHPLRLADMPRLLRVSFTDMAFAATEPYATAAIPAVDVDIAVPPAAAVASAPALATADPSSPIVELAAARHQDAVSLAMLAPPVMPRVQDLTPTPVTPAASTAPSAPSANIQLASLTTDLALPATPPIVLPAMIKVLPPPAPGVPPPSPAQRLHLEGKERAKAEHCLAQAVYFEARDQPYKGQVAVAQVVINRVFSPFYPKTVCGVIYQNAHRHLSCQFTFTCDGKAERVTEHGAWARARRIAKQTLDGKLYVPAVGTATHYHAIYVHPYWTREMHKLVREGIHNFYRPIAWGSGADEPVWSRKALAYRKKQ
jgi:spore germination cell wall hydrolase CwlJ-like protein